MGRGRIGPVYNLKWRKSCFSVSGWFLLFCIVLFSLYRGSHLVHRHFRQWEQVLQPTDFRSRLPGFESRSPPPLPEYDLVRRISLCRPPCPPLWNEGDRVAASMSRWSKCSWAPTALSVDSSLLIEHLRVAAGRTSLGRGKHFFRTTSKKIISQTNFAHSSHLMSFSLGSSTY